MKIYYSFLKISGILIIICTALFISLQAYSNNDGRSRRTLKTTTLGCWDCHGSRDASVGVLINGPSSVTTGQTNTYTVTINKSGQTGAGVDIAARSGVLGVISPQLYSQVGELIQNDNIPMSGGQVTLQFSYTAPVFATVDTLFATGLATNSNGEESGDKWNWAPNFPVTVNPSSKVLHLTALIEGFYNYVSGSMVSDTARVYLRNNSAPYAIADSSIAKLNSPGNGDFSFLNAANAVPYYLVVKHRNSIETWSSIGLSFTADSLDYNFTTASSQAYGNNLKLSGAEYTMFSGDANQDGFADLTDITIVYNDATAFAAGYIVSDMNGDNIIDLTDIVITYNNSSAFVSIKKP